MGKENKARQKGLHFLRVSISAPLRRAALTAFSSFLAAAFRGFFRITTGSQSCVRGPVPAIVDCFCLTSEETLRFITLGLFVCWDYTILSRDGLDLHQHISILRKGTLGPGLN